MKLSSRHRPTPRQAEARRGVVICPPVTLHDERRTLARWCFVWAMFLGMAGYVSAHAAKVWGLPPELAILSGTAAATVLGFPPGLLANRRQGLYFAMIPPAVAPTPLRGRSRRAAKACPPASIGAARSGEPYGARKVRRASLSSRQRTAPPAPGPPRPSRTNCPAAPVSRPPPARAPRQSARGETAARSTTLAAVSPPVKKMWSKALIRAGLTVLR